LFASHPALCGYFVLGMVIFLNDNINVKKRWIMINIIRYDVFYVFGLQDIQRNNGVPAQHYTRSTRKW
jgi:hypothetical protein